MEHYSYYYLTTEIPTLDLIMAHDIHSQIPPDISQVERTRMLRKGRKVYGVNSCFI